VRNTEGKSNENAERLLNIATPHRDRALGTNTLVCRRDFLNAALLVSGSTLLKSRNRIDCSYPIVVDAGRFPTPEPSLPTVPPRLSGEEHSLVARVYNSDFAQAYDTYNGISAASDGKIYYVLSSASIDVGAQMFSYDPTTGRIRHLGDITEACGEKGLKTIPQGKSHVSFVESHGKLYFATHVGYYNLVHGRETMGTPGGGYNAYPGGHFLSYDLSTGKFEELAKAPDGEGIITFAMDTERGRLYGLTWPTGNFLRLDLASKAMKNLGPVSGKGEKGAIGSTYRVLSRSFAVDPADGSVYFTTSDGFIRRYQYDRDAIERVEGVDLKKDYFGCYNTSSDGTMAYNWRQALWYAPEKVIYGVHGNSGYLFRFDPHVPRVDVVDRITSEPSKRSGMFDQFTYGYLGFVLGPDGRTLYYLTGAPIYVSGKRVAGQSTIKIGSKGEEDLHLVTYDIPSGRYADYGAIFLENGQRPAYVNSIAVGKDDNVYALSRISENGRTRTDLIQIQYK
jgi:hypothetical protein